MKLNISRDALVEITVKVAGLGDFIVLCAKEDGTVRLLCAKEEGMVRLAAHDNKVSSLLTLVEAETVETAGTLAVSREMLTSIAKLMPSGSVSLEVIEAETSLGRLQITAGRSKFIVPLRDPKELPALPAYVLGSPCRRVLRDPKELPALPAVSGHVLASALFEAEKSIAPTSTGKRDGGQHIYSGIQIRSLDRDGEHLLQLVATDGYHLAVREMPWRPADKAAAIDVIVPQDVLHSMIKRFAAADTIGLAIDNKVAAMFSPTQVVTGPMLAGTFPNWDKLTVVEGASKLTFSREELCMSIDRMLAAVAFERTSSSTGRLTIDVAEGEATITARSAARDDVTSATDVVAASLTGDKVSATFNAQYLKDALLAVGTDEVSLFISAGSKPVLVTSKDGGRRAMAVLTPIPAKA